MKKKDNDSIILIFVFILLCFVIFIPNLKQNKYTLICENNRLMYKYKNEIKYVLIENRFKIICNNIQE